MRCLAALALTALLAACGDQVSLTTDPTQGPATTYVGDTVQGRELFPGTTIRLTLGGGNISLDAGCNQMSGLAEINNGRLEVASFVSTDMACDSSRMDQDTWVSRFFLRSPSVALTDREIVLTGQGVTLTLTDEKHLQAADPIPLEGTTWVLETILTGSGPDGTASSVPSRASIRMAAQQLRVETGCNRGSGTVEIADETITFSPLAVTKMACPGPRGELEATVTRVLIGDVAYDHDHDVLTLTTPDGETGLQFRAEGVG